MNVFNISIHERMGLVYFPEWALYIILSSLVVVAVVNYQYPTRFFKLLSASVNMNIARQIMREELVFSNRASLLLLLNALLMMSFVSLQVTKYFDLVFVESDILQLLYLGISLFAFYLAKFIVYRLAGAAFYLNLAVKEVIFHVFLYTKVFGLILIPVSLLIAFLPSAYQGGAVWISIALGAFLYLIAFVKGIIITIENKLLSYHLFLYICALEIGPFIVGIKLFNSYFP